MANAARFVHVKEERWRRVSETLEESSVRFVINFFSERARSLSAHTHALT